MFLYCPNEFQTSSDFISQIVWNLLKTGTATIYPNFEEYKINGISRRKYKSFFVVNANSYSIVDNKIQFRLYDKNINADFSDLAFVRWRRNTDNSVFTNLDNSEIRSSASILQNVLKSIPEALKKINGVFNVQGVAGADSMKKAMEEIESHIATSEHGLIFTDLTANFQPTPQNSGIIDELSLQFMRSVISEKYGISKAIISGDYTTEQYNAFFCSCVSPIIKQIEESLSYCLFTKRELEVGHQIKMYDNGLQKLSSSQKIEMAKLSTQAPLLSINNILDMFGLDPIEHGNQYFQDLNHINSENAPFYQIGGGDNQNGN